VAKMTRRSFLGQTALATGAAVAFQSLLERSGFGGRAALRAQAAGFGPLFAKAANNTGEVLLELPEGFQYNVIGKLGSVMSDGRLTPNLHDGMATFSVDRMIHIVRNHEGGGGGQSSAAFGALPYDVRAEGGTTNLVIDPETRLIVQDYASLSGTHRNCAGGPTPWGTWITNEEGTPFPNPGSNTYTKVHGYNFEVSASASEEVTPVPLIAMGRFSHEATAVDPTTNIVYETEDANPSGFYQFIPHERGLGGAGANLASGGVLQMLAVQGLPRYDTRRGQQVGQHLATTWVDIEDPDPVLENGALSVVNQGRARGGAVFSRLEGCWYGNGSIFIVSTDGGDVSQGQIWQYTPLGELEGVLTLVFESPDMNVLNAPDNICVSPSGALVLCEDGGGDEYVHGLTLDGQIFRFAKNIVPGQEGSEFAGSTFSPDGQTLFFNIQGPGYTFAVWPEAGRAWSDGGL
jgi:secreted PhoX family phosphatase